MKPAEHPIVMKTLKTNGQHDQQYALQQFERTVKTRW
jgi:hypothetical protein